MDIDLRINGVSFSLTELLDPKKLASARCEKLGLLSRLAMKPPSGYVLHWAKNCEISCFGDRFLVWANLDTSRGPSEMSGTSAYLYFRDDVLEKVAFQVLLNEMMAIGGTAEFQKFCKDSFGNPVSDSPVSWIDGQAAVFCSLYHTRDKALFVWMTLRYMREHGLSG
jgi:hypothetical protein